MLTIFNTLATSSVIMRFKYVDGCILASEAAAKALDKEQGFIVTFNKNIDFEVT